MSARLTANIRNIVTVARREFLTRAGTRGYIISTLFLVLAAIAMGLAPVLISYIDRNTTQTVAVYVGAVDLRGDPAGTLDALLNGPGAGQSGSAADGSKKEFTVERASDLPAGLLAVQDGKLNALVDIERDAAGQPVFTVYANDPGRNRTAALIAQAAAPIAIADRLGQAGLSAAQQSQLFSPPQVTVRSPDPTKPVASAESVANEISGFAVTFGLVMFLFLAVIMYGTWVAMSVVEEKSNRVMEVILAVATPFQLLCGKVLGVSATALLQFAAVIGAVILALLVQGQVAQVVLGQSAGLTLPEGLTPALLLVFSVYFVLGFLLYAVLFAAAGSLVSRQEDVNQVVLPMTLVATAGYLIGLYASIGLLDAGASWVVLLSWVPFLSPYMMLGRMNAGSAAPIEIMGSMVLLAITIVGAVWVASRIYSAGVLMYGQRPGFRTMWKAIREAR